MEEASYREPTRRRSEADSGLRTAVLVVHGIGKPPAGATVDRLFDSLTSTTEQLQAEGGRGYVALADLDRRDGRAPTFPCHLRRARHPVAGEFVFAEVWWGRTPADRGGIGAVLSLLGSAFGIIVGLGTVFRIAGGPDRPRAETFVVASARTASLLLTGPVFAANLTAMILIAVTSIAHAVPWLDARPAPSIALGAAVAVLVAFVGLRSLVRRSGGHPEWRSLLRPTDTPLDFRGLWTFTALFAVGVAVYAALRAGEWQPYYSDVATVMGHCLSLAMVPMIVAIVAHAVAPAHPDDGPRMKLVATSSALQFSLWAWLIAGCWQLLLPLLAASLPGARPHLQEVETAYQEEFPWPSLPLAGTLLVVATAAIAVIARAVGRRVRLIVQPHVAAALRFAAVATCVVILGGRYFDGSLASQVSEHFASLGLAGIAGLVLSAALLIPRTVRTAISLADDVLTYLAKYAAIRALAPLSRNWNRGDPRKSRAIRSRFRRVVEHLQRRGRFDRVVIVAHSQGTVLVVDELAAARPKSRDPHPLGKATEAAYAALFDPSRTLLVTMGSPLSHIYQHYFSPVYPRWDQRRWERLPDRIGRWLNLYRPDDYVGTTIDEPAPAGIGLRNLGLRPGGHEDYWGDRQVLRVLRVLGLTGTRSPHPAGSTGSASSPR